ncbi:MAG: hypothetical protein COA66_08290 [Arcobacter sp.]|nr:MAG: hypothetical protein COA66_08290 [Arcobacter sp.]
MDVMSSSVQMHVFMLFVFFGIMLFNYYTVSTVKNFIKMAKRLKAMTSIYHIANAMIIYTGMILSAFYHDLAFKVLLMIPTGIFLMVIEIKRFKKMRVIKSTDIELQKAFIPYAKKIYRIEMAVLVVMSTIISLI